MNPLKSGAEILLSDREKQKKHCEAVIASIEAVIEKRANDTHLEMSIGGAAGSRTVKETPLTELIAIREKYMIELRRLKLMEKKHYPKNDFNFIHGKFF